MTIETINIGNAANDGTGDDLREAFIKVNQNFQDIDARTEQTTATNLGLSGYQVFANQSGSQLQFRRLLAGTNVELVQTDTTIRIDAPTQPTSFVVSGDTGSLIAGAGINLAVIGGEGITIGVDNNNKRITVNGGLSLDLSPSLAAGLDGNNKSITFLVDIPEDPAYSTPDGSHFFFFSGRYVRGTMCNSVFFFQLFRVHFPTFKTGT